MRSLLAVVVLVVSACGAPFVPAYPGEPECGSSQAIHGVIGEACSDVAVACSCDDRSTLNCVDGVWVYSHWLCRPGLGVSTN